MNIKCANTFQAHEICKQKYNLFKVKYIFLSTRTEKLIQVKYILLSTRTEKLIQYTTIKFFTIIYNYKVDRLGVLRKYPNISIYV